tara:strand:- start:525 stop:944 length:420 start_codon:yes stop_codon:yes gene_type:complete
MPVNPLYLVAAGISAFGMLYSGKMAKAQAKQQAYELKIQEENERLNAIAEENAIVRENQKILNANLTIMSGGESDLAVIDDNLERQQKDVATSKTKSLLKIDSLRRTGIATRQAGSAAQTASLIKAGGTLMGGYADYKG